MWYKKNYIIASQFMWWSHYTVDIITLVNTVCNQICKPTSSSGYEQNKKL
jgi:hypothetical protein